MQTYYLLHQNHRYPCLKGGLTYEQRTFCGTDGRGKFVLIRSFKTELNPTQEQMSKIKQAIGVCRFIYNLYIAHTEEVYKETGEFTSRKMFMRWLRNDFLPNNKEYGWIKKCGIKSIEYSVIYAEDAYHRFFKKKASHPKFKKKNKSDVKMHFVRYEVKEPIKCERHRIFIPKIGWVRLKEKGYLPTTDSGIYIISGSVSYKAGRYYVSVIADVPSYKQTTNDGDGIGIDVGISNFAILSDGRVFENINKSKRMVKLEKKLKRENRRLSRKYLMNRRKGGSEDKKNIKKQLLKVQKAYHRIDSVRSYYVNSVVNEIVKTKPSFVAIEDLNLAGIAKNKHISGQMWKMKLSEFREKLIRKCKDNGIEVRIVDRWYPSSKRCNNCGKIKPKQKLSERTYRCECGYVNDRDSNASLNLRDCSMYKIA